MDPRKRARIDRIDRIGHQLEALEHDIRTAKTHFAAFDTAGALEILERLGPYMTRTRRELREALREALRA